ncbi:hypothetical protein ABPG74_000881 [Tetrahymena malaccensis]
MESNSINQNLRNNNQHKEQTTYEKISPYIKLLIAGIIVIKCPPLVQNSALILGTGYCIKNEIIDQYLEQERAQTLQDWERQFGLDNFQEVNGESYTQEDLDCVFKQMNIYWNPNKKKTEEKKQFAIKRLQQITQAYDNIKKYHNWN